MSKEIFTSICASGLDIPVFMQPWYLDLCVEDGNWDVSLYYDEAGQLTGFWLYFMKNKWWFKQISMPHLCKFMGLYILDQNKEFKLDRNSLLAGLPRTAYLMQNHYYSTNKIIKSVFEKEYSEGQSYRIDLRSSAEVLWKKLSSDYRNNKIKRAKEKLTLSFKLDIEELYALNQLSFKRQQKDFPVPKSLFKKIIQGCLDKGQGIVLGMHDDQLRWHAGMFLLWDQHSVYYVCGGTNPELRNSGAGIYIIWKAIEWAKTELEVDTFDFLGSNIKNIAKVWRNFGAEATQYPILEISNSKVFQTLRNLKNR